MVIRECPLTMGGGNKKNVGHIQPTNAHDPFH